MFVLYVDDHILMSPDKTLIDKAIKDLTAVELKIKDQGYPPDYVGMNITQSSYGSVKLSQPALIQSIIKDVKLGPRAPSKHVPVPSTKIL